jgi:Fe-S cluster assembly ATP-binding protein
MELLKIDNLHAQLEGGGKAILHGLNLTVQAGQVHAIMGPNGAGKSTLGNILAGKDGYEITAGEVLFNGAPLLELEADERARAGVFLAFQYPVELPGVNVAQFLRTALNAHRAGRNEPEVSGSAFLKLVRGLMASLQMDDGILQRSVNAGFSGGEKKRFEMLQMALFEPSLCILDETDSGLDIDALKVVAAGVNGLRSSGRGFIIITHYQRLLEYIQPDVVHVLAGGKIVQSGGPELAHQLEAQGYAGLAA